jgi:SAM-dependent methyltransferase
MLDPIISAQAQRDLDSEKEVYARWSADAHRWRHVLVNPNADYGQRVFLDTIGRFVQGRRVLELGCGGGGLAARISDLGAEYVLGTDISTSGIAAAQKKYSMPGKLEYCIADATIPFEGVWDVIVGSAVLHHFEYREALLRMHRENLALGGQMIFREPLAANALIRLYRHRVASAHTADEHPFTRADLRWIKRRFPESHYIPVNYVSVPAGAVSSVLFRSPDNPLLRAADRVDRLLARHAEFMHHRFRYVIFTLL